VNQANQESKRFPVKLLSTWIGTTNRIGDTSYHTGMTRSQVRELFGEPDAMYVSGDLEFWEYGQYGRGEIVFSVEGHSDGTLFSWHEP
jgi:hypothetical protein